MTSRKDLSDEVRGLAHQRRRVVVLGGTGFVGRSLCRRLAGRGDWNVQVLTRDLASGTSVAGLPGVQVMVADVFDTVSLRKHLQAADAVVNLVAILHGSARRFHHVHVELPELIGREVRRLGVRRLVHVSALGVHEPGASMYLQSKAWGERLIAGEWPDTTLLRPSVMFGAEDRFINTFARLERFAPVIPLACAQALFQPVWVEDVAQAIVAALDRDDALGRIYECAGPQVLSLRQLVRRAGEWARVARPIVPLPLPVAYAQAWILEQLPGEPVMSRDNLRSMQVPNVASTSLPGLPDLGIAARSIDDYLALG